MPTKDPSIQIELDPSQIGSVGKDVQHLIRQRLLHAAHIAILRRRVGQQHIQISFQHRFGDRTDQGRFHVAVGADQRQMRNGVDAKSLNQWPGLWSVAVHHHEVHLAGIFLLHLLEGGRDDFAVLAPARVLDADECKSKQMNEFMRCWYQYHLAAINRASKPNKTKQNWTKPNRITSHREKEGIPFHRCRWHCKWHRQCHFHFT
mmetsp:Transcript_18726/g.52083  ORF Transcript_18726/g.52083 Transcript_18726/m.52083 type:complete len:204 (-) Transcript_18726:651-1262(-)